MVDSTRRPGDGSRDRIEHADHVPAAVVDRESPVEGDQVALVHARDFGQAGIVHLGMAAGHVVEGRGCRGRHGP